MKSASAAALPQGQDSSQAGSQIEAAYWRLRQEIICGNLAPSTRLRIDLLRQTYGFGASALREALSRLVSDGLAEAEAQRGYWVTPISREELNDITMARRSVEVEALRQAIRFGTLEWESGIVAASHSLERVETSMVKPTPGNHRRLGAGQPAIPHDADRRLSVAVAAALHRVALRSMAALSASHGVAACDPAPGPERGP